VDLSRQFVLSHLEFVVQAWSPWLAKNTEALEKLQKEAVNMVFGLKGSTDEEKLEELGILTLQERRHQADIV
jgi:hypothetical protein